MSISSKQIEELVKHGIIDEATAGRIATFYSNQKAPSGNRLLLAFGILGATLAGLGIILMVAHNWDSMSRIVKSFFAFLPLVLALLLCGYVLLKQSASSTWRESAAILVILSIGASLSLVSQIYHIPGKLSSFVFTWMLVSVGFVYLMRSAAGSLLYIAMSAAYAMDMDNEFSANEVPGKYLILAALIIPFIHQLFKHAPRSNFSAFHHWFIALSLTIVLGFFNTGGEYIGIFQYLSLFTCMHVVGHLYWFDDKSKWSNAYRIIGSAGMLFMLVFLSFDFYWRAWADAGGITIIHDNPLSLATTLALAALPFFIMSAIHLSKKGKWIPNESMAFPMVLVAFFMLPTLPHAGQIITNIALVIVALIIAYQGAKADNLMRLNYGLLILLLVATCRFFDDEISFILRGALFICSGAGLIVANYFMVKKRNKI